MDVRQQRCPEVVEVTNMSNTPHRSLSLATRRRLQRDTRLLEIYRHFVMEITTGTGYVAGLYLLRTL